MNEALKEEARKYDATRYPNNIVTKLLTALEESEKDGCRYCNPVYALEVANDRIKELEEENANYNSNWIPPNVFIDKLIEVDKRGRREVAEEIEKMLLGLFWFQPLKENEPVIYRDQAIATIKSRFMGE